MKNLPKDGVGYITKYNKEEQEITKYASGEAVLLAETSSLNAGISSPDEAKGRETESGFDTPAPTPLGMKDVKRAVVQLWDNGENSKQRYKLKVRINLADGTDADFIAALTKDPRNFVKHTANKELAREWRTEFNQKIKEEFNVKPWLGKFHSVQEGGYKNGFYQQTNEPNCFATVWWDEEAKDWSTTFMIYDFAVSELDLQARNCTELQKKQGCRSSKVWINPMYNDTPRPLTWAEQRALKK